MDLAQLQVWQADILARAGVDFDLADHGEVAAFYNESSGTGFYWRSRVDLEELNTAIDWAAFAGLTAQVQNTYMAMTQGGSIDATSANIRNGFVAVFPDAGGTAATLAALVALASRVPTYLEALFTVSNVCAVEGQRADPALVALALGA
jgi:hypothetical protein